MLETSISSNVWLRCQVSPATTSSNACAISFATAVFTLINVILGVDCHESAPAIKMTSGLRWKQTFFLGWRLLCNIINWALLALLMLKQSDSVQMMMFTPFILCFHRLLSLCFVHVCNKGATSYEKEKKKHAKSCKNAWSVDFSVTVLFLINMSKWDEIDPVLVIFFSSVFSSGRLGIGRREGSRGMLEWGEGQLAN